jgi:hypothetical protein
MIYLISPYTHPEEKVRWRRARLAARAVALCSQKGLFVFSPIAHGHAVHMENARQRQPEISREYWIEFDMQMLDLAGEAFVLTIDGWKDSPGCRDEIDRCKEQAKPLTYFDANMRKVLHASPT